MEERKYIIAFGKALKEIRLEMSLSQEELAFRSDLHVTFISMLENGKRQPTITSFYSIAKALGISGSQFISKIDSYIN